MAAEHCRAARAGYHPHVPELPDVLVYVEALRRRLPGRRLEDIAIRSPSLLRSVEPDPGKLLGRAVVGVERLGKRIVVAFEGEHAAVIHPMIAGRLRWREGRHPPRAKIDLAAFIFGGATLTLTEASMRKRATLHLLDSPEGLEALRPAGIDVRSCPVEAFHARLTRENRTLKRALTNPALFDGIGNAYADEILHAARLSPLRPTRALAGAEVEGLVVAARSTLEVWTARLMRLFALDTEGPGRFPGPGEITAFRPEMAVHGRFGEACPDCAAPVQRIVYAERETNYCPGCQTGGRILADRDLSRLLRDEWPRKLDDLEEG